MKSRDRQSYNIYQTYVVERNSVILMELNQSLKVEPNDVIIEIPELQGYLVMSRRSL